MAKPIPVVAIRLVFLALLILIATVMVRRCGRPERTPVPSAPGPTPTTSAEPGTIDPVTGLLVAPGWELVAANCNACHSTRHFLRMRGTRSTWDSAITWMQKNHGLWPLQTDVRETIVGYLAEHYGPSEASRRAPIPPELLPPNPYPTPARREVRALTGR